jgi:hypothetical protein
VRGGAQQGCKQAPGNVWAQVRMGRVLIFYTFSIDVSTWGNWLEINTSLCRRRLAGMEWRIKSWALAPYSKLLYEPTQQQLWHDDAHIHKYECRYAQLQCDMIM